MSLELVITNAGRAALINAQNSGTEAVTITTVRIGSGQYTPNANYSALQSETKSINTISGIVSDADTISLTVRDESTDTYTANEIGLYTNDNTLFALYSHPTETILEKAEQGVVLLALDIKLEQADAAVIEFGDTNFLLPSATETISGVLTLATTAQAKARTNNENALTPYSGSELLSEHENAEQAHSWDQISEKPTTYPPATHSHAWLAITGKPVTFPPSAHGHDWGNLSNVPTTFVPSAHGHAWSEITSKPTTFAPSAHSHAWSTITGKPADYPATAHTHLWTDITDKPTTFAPSAHSHAWNTITGRPSSFTPTEHTHLWADITDKPTTFTPSAHSHAWSTITGKPADYPATAHTHLWADITNKPTTFTPSAHSHAWGEITGKPSSFTPAIHGHAWSEITDTPASFPPIAHGHTWGEISGKPSTFTPSAHGHAWSEITGKPTTFNASAHGHTKAEVGLGNVDNTSDAAKPVSSATQAALNAKLGSTATAANSQKLDGYDSTAFIRNFVVEDGDGSEVTISHGSELKFVEGFGLDINFTDTSPGSDADPFDLTFSVVDSPKLSGLSLRASGTNWNTVANIASTGSLAGMRYLDFVGSNTKTDGFDYRIGYSTTSENGSLLFYNDAGTERFQFTDGGEFRADGDVVAGYSDVRLKNIIGPIESALESIQQWEPFYYTATQQLEDITDGAFKQSQLEVGLSAQSVQSTHPELIRHAPFDRNEKGESKSGEDYLTLRYERITPILVAALQQHKQQTDAAINALTTAVIELTKMVQAKK